MRILDSAPSLPSTELVTPLPGSAPRPAARASKPAIVERVAAYLREHPKASAGWIAAALHLTLREVDRALAELQRAAERPTTGRQREKVLEVLRAADRELYVMEVVDRITGSYYARIKSHLNHLETHGLVTGRTLTRSEARALYGMDERMKTGQPRRYYRPVAR